MSARDEGEAVLRSVATQLRRPWQEALRLRIGLEGEPPPICDDPELAYGVVDGMAWTVHGDLGPMLIGGLASLLLQTLHPLAMQGVAEHSRYQSDPLGRLRQTATFIAVTTYGTRNDAEAAIERVIAVHRGVSGTSASGVSYRASDPELLLWVHACEVKMFLAAAVRYGARNLTTSERDRYVEEMATVARDLGVIEPPRTVADVDDALERFQPQLQLIPDGFSARDFVLRGVGHSNADRAVYRLLSSAAIGILPDWAGPLLRLRPRRTPQALTVQPAATALCGALRLAVPPQR